jgi:hypothetical protein
LAALIPQANRWPGCGPNVTIRWQILIADLSQQVELAGEPMVTC